MLDDARGRDGQHGQRQHDQEQVLNVWQRKRLDLGRADHIGAPRAPHIVPVNHQGLQHHREREGRDGEERPAKPQRQIAHSESHQTGHHGADDKEHRHRHRVEFVEKHRRIGAEREERRGAEVHVARIAAEDIPGGREHDELQYRVTGEEYIVVAGRPGAREHEGGDHRAREDESAGTDGGVHGRPAIYRPSSPAGRNASVSSRSPNETAGAHDGP